MNTTKRQWTLGLRMTALSIILSGALGFIGQHIDTSNNLSFKCDTEDCDPLPQAS